MYKVLFTKKAEKGLDKLALKDIKSTLKKVSKLNYPFPKNFDIKGIVDVKGFYRLRSGKVRVIFEIDEKKGKIWIRKIGYRGGIYRF